MQRVSPVFRVRLRSRLALGFIASFAVVGILGCVLNDAAAAGPDTGDLVTLGTSALTLTIKRTPAPHIVQLTPRDTETNLVSDPAAPGIFAIALAGGQYMESQQALTTRLEVTRSPLGDEVVMTFSGFPGLDLSASVHGIFSDQEALSQWTIEVKNRTGRKIDYVRFPILRSVPGIGDAQDDFIVLPRLPGALIRGPWKSWKADDGAWLSFPGELSAQFIAYQDTSAGIFLSSRDAEGYPKRLEIWKKAEGFWLAHDYFLSADAGQVWQSPYPVSLGVTRGTWQDAADLYKQWAVTQPWCARTLVERDDVPLWWRQGPLVYVSSMRTYDGNMRQAGSWYPRLLESLRLLKSQTGGPIVAMLADWENHRRWTAGDYFPVFDEKNARRAISQAGAEGFRTFFYLSGLNYTFENEGVNGSKITVPGELSSQFVVDASTGKPQVFSIDESTAGQQWKRDSYAFCAASPLVKTFFDGVIDRVLDLGVTVVQMDQTTNGAGFACWSNQHGHVPGVGLYQAREFQALLREMRAHGKAVNPDFVLLHEEPHEELIPFLDGFHTREYYEQQWYRDLPGAVGIPLFSYLYHEYAVCYGGDSASIGPRGTRNIPWFVRCHAVNLVTGKTPGAATWFYPDQLFNADPRTLKMLRSHSRLLAAGASSFLIDGRMLHPFEIKAPTLTYTGADRGVPDKGEFSGPAVLTSSWEAPDGSVGHVFVNLTSASFPVEIDLDTRNAPGFASCDVSVYRSEGVGGFQPLWKAITLPRRFSTALAPDEVLFVEIRSAEAP